MIIVVEGPDNVGKSTLINNIKNEVKDILFHTIHYGSIKHNSVEECIEYNKELYNSMFSLMKASSNLDRTGLIFDRSHLGEMVYGNIYRGYTGEYVLDIEEKYKQEKFFKNVYLITLTDEPENLIKREDGLSFSIDPLKKQREIDLFLKAHLSSNIKNKLYLNINNLDANAVLREVLDFLNKGD